MFRIVWNELLKRCKSETGKTEIREKYTKKERKTKQQKQKTESSLITVLKSMA